MVAWRGIRVVSTQPTVVPLNFMEDLFIFALNHTNSCDVNRNWDEALGTGLKKKKKQESQTDLKRPAGVCIEREPRVINIRVLERCSVCLTSFPLL